jgi:hypothetical protein
MHFVLCNSVSCVEILRASYEMNVAYGRFQEQTLVNNSKTISTKQGRQVSGLATYQASSASVLGTGFINAAR